jgi:membrane protein
MLASLALTTATEALARYAGAGPAVPAANLAAMFAAEAVLFALVFKFLPNAQLHWRDAAAGAVLTAVLFTIGKVLVGLYLRHTGSLSGFGAAASLMALLVWIYFSALVLVFGAEVTKVAARRAGRTILPTENAEVIRDY